MSANNDDLLFAKLNVETAVIPWRELQRFFAQGKVLVVNKDIDLVTMARDIAANQSDRVLESMKRSSLNLVSDDQAKKWIKDDTPLWAVVVAPWVLVQELGEGD